MPTTLVQKWRGNAVAGGQFQKLLDSFLEHYEIIDAQSTGGSGDTPKRPNGEPGETPTKRPRVDSTLLVEAASLEQPLLYECRVGSNSKDSVWLQVRAGNTILLVNKGTHDWAGKDAPICGFGKGSFKIIKAEAELPEGGVELSLHGSSDMICYDGRVVTLGDTLRTLRGKNPETKITYFKINFDTEDPHKFELQKSHRVIFVPRPDEKSAEVKDSNAAAREKVELWNSSPSVAVMWHMKHSAVKGLLPLKPAVFLKAAVVIPAQQALFLVKP